MNFPPRDFPTEPTPIKPFTNTTLPFACHRPLPRMKTICHIVAALLSIMVVIFQAGCSSTPSPSGLALQDTLVRGLGSTNPDDKPSTLASTKSVTAAKDDWELSVQWNPRDLKRTVKWRKDGKGFELVIPLERRSQPWSNTFDNIRMTSYGPYQPAYSFVSGGSRWAVVMSHEQVDFPTTEELLAYLQRQYQFFPNQIALAADGTFVQLLVYYSSIGNSLNVTVERLTVQGRPLSPERLKRFITGRIKETGQKDVLNSQPWPKS